MLQPKFTEEEIAHIYQLFMEHPSRVGRKKLPVVYLKALELSQQEIVHIARVSGDGVTRYLHAYIEGGVKALCSSQRHCLRSALLPHSEVLKTRFQAHPPHTVAEAAYEIEKLTGIQLALSACRDFMHKHLGMKYRKMAVILSKAAPDKQSDFLHNKLETLLEEEKLGKRRGFFVDAAHFVMGTFLGMLLCFERLFLKSSSGRNRYNVLGAYSVKDSELITITNDAYINSDTLVELLTTISKLHAETAINLILDNARYQRCDKMINKALELGIDLQFLPQYSPSLELIERLWKFTKKQCLYNRDYQSFCQFKAAIDDYFNKVNSIFSKQVKTLLKPNFQLFPKS